MKKNFLNGLIFSFALVIGICLFGTIAFKVYAALSNVNSGDVLTATNWNEMISEINSLKSTISSLNSIPSGSIVAFNSSTCPTGWSKANGTNGTPDLRGEFVRGWDDGKGTDSSRTIGSFQGFGIQSHTHYIRQIGTTNIIGGSMNVYGPTGAFADSTSEIAGGASSETRPRNIALLYCIKN